MTWAFTTYCYLGFLFQSSNQSQLTTSPRQSWNCNGTSSARPVWEPGPSSRSLQRPFHRLSVPSCWNWEESRLEPVDVDAGKVFQPSAPRPAAWHSPCLIWKTSFRLQLPSHSCPARALRALGLLLAGVALTVGWGDFSFTKTAVTQKRKVEKSIVRCEMDRLTEDYKRAVDKICSRTAKNGFLGQKTSFRSQKKLASWCKPCSSHSWEKLSKQKRTLSPKKKHSFNFSSYMGVKSFAFSRKN